MNRLFPFLNLDNFSPKIMMRSYLLKLLFSSLLLTLLAACGGSSETASTANSNQAAGATLAAAGTSSLYVAPRTGWFWNAAESGRGFAIERQGSQIFLAGFMYETTGESTWYATTMNVQADGSYQGDLLRYTGGQTLLGSYQSATSSKYATITAAFSSATKGTLQIKDVNSSASITISLDAFPISTPTAFAPSTDAFQSGWWWNPAEGGRGYFIEAQGAQAFIAAFMYSGNGQPTWYASAANLLTPSRISGSLLSYTSGQTMYGAYQSATLSGTSAGVMSFEMTSNNTGVMTLPNGSKVNLQRFIFNNDPVTAETAKPLMISEVASAYYTNSAVWFEVYNPNATISINLSDYTLNSSHFDGGTSYYYAPASFTLPSVTIPPKGYLVIASKTKANLTNNAQMVYVSNGSSIPFWGASGNIELVKGGVTADFVRFGNSASAPTTASAWSGANAPALPNTANYGYSIVRLASSGMVNNFTGSDWSSVNFSTPGGPNDVGVGVLDSDGDGIPDSAKVSGKTFAGLDLYSLGARPGQRDLFIQIDSMSSTDPGIILRQEAVQKLVDTFANHTFTNGNKKIAVHVDAGTLYSPTINTAAFNLGGGKMLAYASCLAMESTNTVPTGCANLYDFKRDNMDVRRKLIFHYAVMGSSQKTDGSCGSSGLGELNGNDFIITMGNCGFKVTSATNINYTVNGQAATIMHELGHNLGLNHGGFEANNYKPNYYSIMNYTYSFPGLSANPSGPQAANRFYLNNSTYTKASGINICNIDNSPCGTSFIMDYSNGSSIDLDENNLDESKNIGRGAVAGAYADWDNSNSQTSGTFAYNIHKPDSTATLGVLKDYNDWDNLVLAFTRSYQGAESGAVVPTAVTRNLVPRKNPMHDGPGTLIREDPAIFLRHLESIRRAHP